MRCPTCNRRVGANATCGLHPNAAVAVAPAAPFVALDPPKIDGFADWQVLGSGGFATVFRARSEGSGEVAVKISAPIHAERMEREAAALRSVGPPVTPALRSSGVDCDGRPYIVMDYLAGSALSERLEDGSAPLSPAVALGLLRQLAVAVDELHARGIVHRDLKPENILIGADGSVRIIDLGLARASGAPSDAPTALRVTRTGFRVGTVTYSAPEQPGGGDVVDPRSDLYSVGVIAFEMLTGRPPFVGSPTVVEKDHMMARVPRASRLAQLPAAVDDVFARALAKEPAARFASAGELVAALTDAMQATPRAGPERAPAAVSARSSTRRPVALLAARAAAGASLNLESMLADGAELVFRGHDRCVLAFPHAAGAQAGVRAALGAAERLQTVAAVCVLHHAELLVRQTPRRTTLLGAAVEHPESWWPAREAGRLLLTAAAAEVLGGRVIEPADVEGYFVVGAQKVWASEASAHEAPALRGREALIATLLYGARRCRDSSAAGLMTIVGEPGMGKTRVLDAVATELAADDFQVLRLGALAPERGSADSLTRALVRSLFELAEGASAADVRDRCAALLGDDGEAVWPAVALALGALEASAPEASATLRAVGAARQSVALAIGHRLQRLAATRPLALLVDDLQWADASALDALELATSSAGRLWVCVATRPALLSAHPTWGDRALDRDTRTLGPIATEAAAELIRALLRPIEFLPAAVVERLVERTGAVPLYLVELCQALRRGGAVRRHPGSNAWYLAPDELLHATPVSLQERLAERVLSTLPPTLVALAQLCAVIGDDFDTGDVEAAVQHLERDSEDVVVGIDASIGLVQLERSSILERQGRRYRFRNPILRRAIEDGSEAATRRRLHEACLQMLLERATRSAGQQLRLARHAVACGRNAEAAAVYRQLADEARIVQRWVDAEQGYSAALELCAGGDDPARVELLANRGRVRYRLGLLRESVDDLQQARRLARALGDERTVVDVMLEEATVHDWLEDYGRSAALADELEGPVARLRDPVLDARWSLARARGVFRQGFEVRAIEPLRRALAQADAVADYDTQIVCYLLLPYALLQAGRIDESEELAAAAIALCERAGDRVHLGVAHLNRIYLWMCLGKKERALDDYRTAVRVAKEFGLAKIASHASQIHCEILYYFGDLTAAAELARQVIALDDRYQNPNADLLILAARVLCATGEHAEAQRICRFLSENQLRNATCQARFMLRLVERYLVAVRAGGVTAADWTALLDERPEHLLINENVEAFYWAIAGLARTGATSLAAELAERVKKVDGYVVWRARFDAVLAGAAR